MYVVFIAIMTTKLISRMISIYPDWTYSSIVIKNYTTKCYNFCTKSTNLEKLRSIWWKRITVDATPRTYSASIFRWKFSYEVWFFVCRKKWSFSPEARSGFCCNVAFSCGSSQSNVMNIKKHESYSFYWIVS